jgi:hypothetical protein
VAGNDYVGGLVAYGRDATISNSYAKGAVQANSKAGGLVAVVEDGGISNSFAVATVMAASSAGGLLAENTGTTISGCFWDSDRSGQDSSAGGTPKTTAEMKTRSTFTDAGWDLVEVWDIGENQTYPFLRVYAAGDINHDGVVDFRDLAYLGERWLEGR